MEESQKLDQGKGGWMISSDDWRTEGNRSMMSEKPCGLITEPCPFKVIIILLIMIMVICF